MFHRGTLPGNKKKRQLSQKFNFLAKIKFSEKVLLSVKKKIKKKSDMSGISYFVIYFGKLLKGYPLNCSGTDTLNASKLFRGCLLARWDAWHSTCTHVYVRLHTHTYTHTCKHTVAHHKQAANWFRQLNIWHLRAPIASHSEDWAPENERWALSCSPITLILMFKQIRSICRWHRMGTKGTLVILQNDINTFVTRTSGEPQTRRLYGETASH